MYFQIPNDFFWKHKANFENDFINLMSIIIGASRNMYIRGKKNVWAYMGNANKHTCVFFNCRMANKQCYRFRGQTHHAFFSSLVVSVHWSYCVCRSVDIKWTNRNCNNNLNATQISVVDNTRIKWNNT